jgi:hypothetical protein
MSGIGEKISLLIGMKDTGKTVYLRGSEEHSVEGFFRMYLEAGIKILIVDTEDHEKYRDIPMIQLDELPYWKQGVYRLILPDDEMIYLYHVLLDRNKEFRNLDNMFLVFEDAHKHIETKVNGILRKFLLDAKNRHIEIALMYHAWGWVPDDLYRIINLIQVFKTNDHPDVKKKMMRGYFDLAVAAYEKVNAKGTVPWATTMVETGI